MTERRCSNPRCGGILLPEWGRFKRCPTCRENGNEEVKRRYSTARGRRLRRDAMRRYRAKHRKELQAYERLVYAERDAAGVCVECESPRAPGVKRCAKHRDLHAKWDRDRRQRKAAGVRAGKRIGRRRGRLPQRKDAPFDPGQTSTPVADYENGELKLTEAVVRYAELCNGITVREIGIAFHADEGERDRITHAIGRALKSGRLVAFDGDVDDLGERFIYPNRQKAKAA